MEKENKEKIIKIVLSSILLILSYMLDVKFGFNVWVRRLVFFIPYIIISFEAILEVIENIVKGLNVFDEDFLMVVASLGAYILGEYNEATIVFVLYSIGEMLEDMAIYKSEKSILDLLDLRPDYCNILDKDNLRRVDPNDIKIGDTVYIRPGEKIPFDGEVIDIVGSKEASLDTSSLTGESKKRIANIGDKILSGFTNISGNNREVLQSEISDIIDGTIALKVEKSFSDSTATKIINLVESEEKKKAKSEKFITKFARVYTPIVCLFAILIILIPGIITNDFSTWIYRGLTFLVISCPCALVISIPLTFFSSIGGASKKGILIKGANIMEDLSKVSIIAFDKTGTLTEGNLDNDKVKDTAHESITTLKKMGIRYTIMLTGDYKSIAFDIGDALGIDKVIPELLPDGKVEEVERLLKEKEEKDVVAYVGDGINDAPCMLKSDIGIAMGLKGSDAAIEASDVVLMDDNPIKISKAIKLSRKCLRIVKENIIFSIFVKAMCLILGAFGVINMWLAIFSDVGVMILAVLNALRGLKEKNA